jgi:bifunctional non-homologous end joining protein LigD
VTWQEVARGIRIEDFTIENVPARVDRVGDLWKPLLQKRGRVDLAALLAGGSGRRAGAQRRVRV